jgi:hypothetical protein
LYDYLKNTDLGIFQGIPTADDLLQRVKDKNPILVKEELEIASIGHGVATVRVKKDSRVYAPDAIEVTYIETTKLETVLKVTDLG